MPCMSELGTILTAIVTPFDEDLLYSIRLPGMCRRRIRLSVPASVTITADWNNFNIFSYHSIILVLPDIELYLSTHGIKNTGATQQARLIQALSQNPRMRGDSDDVLVNMWLDQYIVMV